METLLLEAPEGRQLAPGTLHVGGEPARPAAPRARGERSWPPAPPARRSFTKADPRDRAPIAEGEEGERSRGGQRPWERARAKVVGQEVRHRQPPATALERDGEGRQGSRPRGPRSRAGRRCRYARQRLHLESRRGQPSDDDPPRARPGRISGSAASVRRDLSLQSSASRLGIGRHREGAARHHPAADNHGELRVGRFEPQHDAPASGTARHQTGEAVDPHADQPGNEAGVSRSWRIRSWLRRSTATRRTRSGRPAPLSRTSKSKSASGGEEVALELEPDHTPKIRAGVRRQLDCWRRPRAAGDRRSAPGADPVLGELTPDGRRRVLVGRHAERCDHPPRAEPLRRATTPTCPSRRVSPTMSLTGALLRLASAGRPAGRPPASRPSAAWQCARAPALASQRPTREPVPAGPAVRAGVCRSACHSGFPRFGAVCTTAVRTAAPPARDPPAHASMRNVSELIR